LCGHKLGKISRLLKRGKISKERDSAQSQNVSQEVPKSSSSSSFGKEAARVGKGIVDESGVKRKGNGSTGPEKVFRFKDEHEGEIRQVELTITSYSKHNLGRRATMVESLLGIVPSRFSPSHSHSNSYIASNAMTSATSTITTTNNTTCQHQPSCGTVCDRSSSKPLPVNNVRPSSIFYIQFP
jgi:hypothetical protein